MTTSEWQPIETAPTDYTEVIGINAKGHISRTWFFAPSSRSEYWLKIPNNTKWNPTHWMPLPAFSKAISAAEEV